jgi:protein-tyrosine phosphatase
MNRDEAAVLFVCHANLCRSPMAERLAEVAAAQRLGRAVDGSPVPDLGGVRFASAGTHAIAGDPMHRHSVRTLLEHGASTRPFFSRVADEAVLTRADLVLTAGREQRAHCVGLAPVTVRRTFTLREFARLCGAVDARELPAGSPATRMLALVRAAAAARAGFQPAAASADDLADPVGSGLDAFLACGRLVVAALDAIIDRVIPAPAENGRAPSPAAESAAR